MRHAGIANGSRYIVEPIAQIAHESVSLADTLGTGQRPEPAHTAYAALEMLMVALDALLLHLASDVLDLWQAGG